MKTSRLVHWCSLALLALSGVGAIWTELKAKPTIPPESVAVVFQLLLWLSLAVMLYRRPKKWGLGIGVFLIVVVAIQLGLWRLALTKKDEYGVSDSWPKFVASVIPLLLAAIGSISLRWLSQEEPNQFRQPTQRAVD